VAWRRNGQDWLVILPAETFARLLRGSDLVERMIAAQLTYENVERKAP